MSAELICLTTPETCRFTVPSSSKDEQARKPFAEDGPEKSDAELNSASSIPTNRYATFFSLAIVGATLDLWTKHAVFSWLGPPDLTAPNRRVHWLVDGFVGIETAVNIGAVFGIGAGKGHVFALMSVIAAIVIFVWLFMKGAAREWLLTIALGCVMAGIIGNLYDRLGIWWQPGMPDAWKSGVRDWILFQASDRWVWPNFNIADSLLVCGAGMLIWRSFFPVEETSEEATSDKESE